MRACRDAAGLPRPAPDERAEISDPDALLRSAHALPRRNQLDEAKERLALAQAIPTGKHKRCGRHGGEPWSSRRAVVSSRACIEVVGSAPYPA